MLRIPFDPGCEISVILVTANVLTAECTKYWQLLLCQGILTGFACGMSFGPAPAVVAQWFEKRRSLAFAIVSIGTSLGGTVFPIIARNLIELIGYGTTSTHALNGANEFLQFQMGNAGYCPGPTLRARHYEPGGNFYVRPSWNQLSGVSSRLSDEGLIHPNALSGFSLGTISRNLRSMCVSLLVFSISWVFLQVCSPTSPPLLFRD